MNPIGFEEACAVLLAAADRQPTIRMPLENTPGHVLAEEVVARWHLPPWTAASMDGYATRAGDVIGAGPESPKLLPLSGGATAGGEVPPPLAPGALWRVATGGRIPAGADSVIRQEDTDRGTEIVTIHSDRDAGRHLRPAGGDIQSGTVAMTAGTLIGPNEVALLAALGEATPLVVRRPRLSVITSGDEIAPLDHFDALSNSEFIADANGPMLLALLTEAGAVGTVIGPLDDDRAVLAKAVEEAGSADLIITAGAVSVGDHDHVPGVMADLGATILFRRVLLRPGGPATAAVLPDGRIWLALPGNPVSARVTFELFARPLIRTLLGDPRPLPQFSSATLGIEQQRHPRLDLFLRVRSTEGVENGIPSLVTTGDQGSWVLSSLAAADGLAWIRAGDEPIRPGERVSWLPW